MSAWCSHREGVGQVMIQEDYEYLHQRIMSIHTL